MNPYPYVLNNPLKYVDPLGLRNMAEGGSGATNTPTPIINTKPKQNVVNQVKEEVVKKETRGASSWSCKITSDGMGNCSTRTQPQSSFWSDIGNGVRQITMPVMDFVQGVGAGVLESVSFGVSRDLEVYYDRDNEIIYLIGKVVGNTATGIVSGIGTAGSGAAAVATSPTGVRAVVFGAATVYCGSVTVSAAGNAVANVMQIVSKASSGGGSNAPKNNTPADSPKDFIKLKKGQGWKDLDGNIWEKNMLHKDHYDISDSKGNKIKEIDFNGNEIWPNGPKNKNKKP